MNAVGEWVGRMPPGRSAPLGESPTPITSTLCEFLIHPGLFWRFSGRDAERLAAARRVDVLDDPPAAP